MTSARLGSWTCIFWPGSLAATGRRAQLTPAWDGGLYWAGQRLDAKTAEAQGSTKSIALFYLSAWKNAASAEAFAHLYTQELGRKYSGLKLVPDVELPRPAALSTASPESQDVEQVYSTDEGPVVITTRGKLVFVAESFPLEMARQLTALILDAQGSGELHQAGIRQPAGSTMVAGKALTGNLTRFLSTSGVMKAAVDAGLKAAR